MEREDLLRQVRARLAGRNLVYFGTRGDDVEGVADLPELAAVFSVVAPYRRRASVRSAALEEFTGRRVDLDVHDIDDSPRAPEVIELRRAVLRALSAESVVFTYRPSTFLSSVCFARQDRCTYAGLFKDHQSAFEHKPWVESELRRIGIPSIPWTYIADEEQLATLEFLAEGPVMLRRSRSSGGTGLTRIESGSDLAASWPHQDEIYASVAPYLAGGVSTNVSAVAWDDGITLHHPSVQLIGVPECTTRPFGYCGNDFSAVADVSEQALVQMERSTITIGHWLRARGYRGAFGVDFLVVDRTALFTEVNPRFQGVTHASCQLAAAAGKSCVMLEHLAAMLGIAAPPSPSLVDLVSSTPSFAHLVLHSLAPTPDTVDGRHVVERISEEGGIRRADVVCGPELVADPGATVARITVADRVTSDGTMLHADWARRVSGATRLLNYEAT